MMSETWTDAVCLRAGVSQAWAVLPAGLVRGIRGGAVAPCVVKGRPRTDARAARGLHQVPQIQRESVREEQSADKWVELSNAQRVNSAVSREAVNGS